MGYRLGIIGFIVLLAVGLPACQAAPDPDNPPSEKATETREWVVKWKGEPDEDFLKTVDVLRTDGEDPHTMLVRVKKDIDQEKWRAEWLLNQNIEYIQPNFQYKINDEPGRTVGGMEEAVLRSLRNYFLHMTQAKQAHERWDPKREIVIAVIDTGVDTSHPLIAPHLVKQTNIVYPGDSAHDITIEDVLRPEEVGKTDEEIRQMYELGAEGSYEDYQSRLGAVGHGTGVTGVLLQMLGLIDGEEPVQPTEYSAKIMPVKVMGFSNGIKEGGSDFDMAEGIRMAVKRGAHIISLSLGDWAYSKNARDAIDFAEKSGVLVVAAAGNQSEGINEPIFYPAALPDVLAVGGVKLDGTHDEYSNYGAGLDIVAPDEQIWTTDVGGGFTWVDGNSFATPQVAAVAAMVMQQYPDMTPADVRNLIRQTADREGDVWNEKTGYGRLNALRAVTEQPKDDFFEPNDSPERAARVSYDSRIGGALQPGADEDWFYFEIPYLGDGMHFLMKLKLTFSERPEHGVALFVKRPGENNVLTYPVQKKSDEVLLSVGSGRVLIGLRLPEEKASSALRYTFESQLMMEPDAYTDNSHQWKAYNLDPVEDQMIEGTFHTEGKQSWFRIKTPEVGNMTVRLWATTPRIDPVLFVQQLGGTYGVLQDATGPMGEEALSIRVEAGGVYYLRITNANISAPLGKYQLAINYEPVVTGGNEQNKSSDTAAILSGGDPLKEASLANTSDYDWYTFHLVNEDEVSLMIQDVDKAVDLEVVVYDSSLKGVDRKVIKRGNETFLWQDNLPAGQYFVRVRLLSGEGMASYRIGMLSK